MIKQSNALTSSSIPIGWESNKPSFMVVDLDECPDGVPQGVGICLFRDKSYIDTISLEKNQVRTCKAKTAVKPTILQSSLGALEVKLACTNSYSGDCPRATRDWSCATCMQKIRYGFYQMFYCECGTAPMETYAFQCDSDKHGNSYVPLQKSTVTIKVSHVSW